MLRSRLIELPDPGSAAFRHVLLASEGRKIPDEAIRFAAKLARRGKAKVNVFSIARIWGTSLGMPTPGLLPTRKEWDEQRQHVADAVKALEQRNVSAEGQVTGTRRPGRRIIAEAKRLGCDVIVMAAEPQRHWLIGSLLWSQEPYRVRQHSPLPVYVVQLPMSKPRSKAS